MLKNYCVHPSLAMDVMRDKIQFGATVDDNGILYIIRELDPSSLNLALWLKCVPESYKPGVLRAIHKASEILLFVRADDVSKECFISKFHSIMLEDAYSGLLTVESWK